MAKRRSNGEGYIRQLKSGTWFGQIMDGFTPEGKKNVVSFTAPTKGELRQKIRQYQADRDAGKVRATQKTGFSAWADVWYADYKSQVQPSTYSGYKNTLNLLKAHFGDTALSAIKPIDINQFMDELVQQKSSLSKISKCRAMLIQIFDGAEGNELIQRNPARHAKVIRDLNFCKKKKDSFSAQEVDVLMEQLPRNLLGHSIRVMLVSGLRTQELLALKPEDIEPDGSMIRVNKAIKMVDGRPMLGPPKSQQSKRMIPIPEKYRTSAIYIREHGGAALIWSSAKGNLLYSVGTFRKHYCKELAKIEGVRKLMPHCCRHTYVTMLQAGGVPMETISRLVGHASITTTDGYLHITDAILRQAVEAFGDRGGVGKHQPDTTLKTAEI